MKQRKIPKKTGDLASSTGFSSFFSSEKQFFSKPTFKLLKFVNFYE